MPRIAVWIGRLARLAEERCAAIVLMLLALTIFPTSSVLGQFVRQDGTTPLHRQLERRKLHDHVSELGQLDKRLEPQRARQELSQSRSRRSSPSLD